MPAVKVFNPADTPVIVDQGRTVGGHEWQSVEQSALVDELVQQRLLITKKKPQPQPENSPADETAVPSETSVEDKAVSDKNDSGNSPEASDSDAATISRSRRLPRKSPEKE